MAYTPYQPYDWETGEVITEGKLDHIEEGLVAAGEQIAENESDIAELNEQMPTKASIDQSYSDLGAGYAAAIEPTQYTVDEQPYLFRKALGARLTSEKIVGGTVAWNQLSKIVSIMWGPGGSGAYLGISITKVDDATLHISGTATDAAWARAYSTEEAFSPNHVYYVNSNDSRVPIRIGNSSQLTTAQGIIKPTTSTEAAVIFTIASGTDFGSNGVDIKPIIIDLTLAFGTTIADHIYALEQAQAGAGVAWLRNNGFMTKDYYAYNAGELMSMLTSGHRTVGFNAFDKSTATQGKVLNASNSEYALEIGAHSDYIPVIGGASYCVKYSGVANLYRFITYDANKNFIGHSANGGTSSYAYVIETLPANCCYVRLNMLKSELDTACFNLSDPAKNGTYEPYEEHLYPLSPVSLRGIMTLENGKLKNDGDEYYPSGLIKRNWAERDYQEGDASDGSTMITNGIKTVYKLTTPTTETTDPYQSEQTCSEYGTEQFIDERDVPIPVGHVTKYWPDLVAKIEGLPDVTAIADVENGTKASRAYVVGEYFFHNGEFCKAKTAIASGATFTLNTNYETTTIAAELYAALNS